MTKKVDLYHIHNETWTCGDGCCFNDETYIEKNGVRYQRTFEDNGEMYEDDMSFIGTADIIEFILNKEFNIKVARYMADWESYTFNSKENYDYLLLDGYSTEGFDDYYYVLDRKDYLDNLDLKGINKDNIKTDYTKKKEPDEIYEDLFKKVTGCELSYSSSHQDNTIDFDDDFNA